MITKGKLTDQILRLYTGGNPSDDKEISRADVNLLVGQAINQILKKEYVASGISQGEMFPPHTLVTTYKSTIVANAGFQHPYALLPVMPISLPRNMGVWRVVPASSEADKVSSSFDQELIPIQTGQLSALNSQEQTQYLEDQVGYWAEGNKIFFNKDVLNSSTHRFGAVFISLLVIDPTVLGEYDYLAIPAEHEDSIIKECLTILGALPKMVDKVSDSNNQL
tara:strand:- start:655 stop:1320 length:666 start_codon:yes stop_codon:yes gene_type:complete